ncbi:MAG: LEA type 2 family protein [Cyclobacteriaceae bacterium]|nr:LEA type 2 family protein [Cytophagales bacterium]MBX2899123.1 LEA type 2 family protein [Cyclobacteriaceae bacterium]
MSNGIKALLIFCLAVAHACAPKEEIVFKGISNVEVQVGSTNNPELLAKAHFHNPNNVGMKLKEIHVDVLVDGKLSAEVRQKLQLKISPRSDFMVPLQATLSLKELGLLDTIRNLLGGKKYEVQYVGYVRVAMHGVTVKVPVKHREEMRIRL